MGHVMIISMLKTRIKSHADFNRVYRGDRPWIVLLEKRVRNTRVDLEKDMEKKRGKCMVGG